MHIYNINSSIHSTVLGLCLSQEQEKGYHLDRLPVHHIYTFIHTLEYLDKNHARTGRINLTQKGWSRQVSADWNQRPPGSLSPSDDSNTHCSICVQHIVTYCIAIKL